jgi:hypothetical protein
MTIKNIFTQKNISHLVQNSISFFVPKSPLILLVVLFSAAPLNRLLAQSPSWVTNSSVPNDSFAEAYVSSNFTYEQRQVIFEALKLANQLSQRKNDWTKCLTTNSKREIGTSWGPDALPNSWPFWPRSLSFWREKKSTYGILYIIRIRDMDKSYADKEEILGLAPVEIGLTPDGLNIALNENVLLKHSKDVWAGVIVHEIMHNLGYRHTKVNGTFNGSFIYESGWCFERGFAPKPLNLDGSPVGGTVIGD